jgi:TldD protein
LFFVGCGATPSAPKHRELAPPVVADVPSRVDAVRPPPTGGAKPAPILEQLGAELDRSMKELAKQPVAPYFASYEVNDIATVNIEASFGKLRSSSDTHARTLDVDVRLGDFKLDNTHAVADRMAAYGDRNTVTKRLPVEEDEYATRTALWLATDEAYKSAQRKLEKVRADAQVSVAAEDRSDDFSREPPTQYYEPPVVIAIDRAVWEPRLRALSAELGKYGDITGSSVTLSSNATTTYFASSEGARYQTPHPHIRLSISAWTTAEDGMELHRFEAFDVGRLDQLPADDVIRAKIDVVAHDLVALRKAPVAEPYIGPAILEGKAAGVFFHEVFGHRIEGHRQKANDEGQTFAKMIGQAIMPAFISVFDDPTIETLNDEALNGYYRYDDQGVPAANASLVENGVLKTFLMSRSPTRGVTRSNGHGRRSEGFSVVSRQGNLVVAASHTVADAELKAQLLREVKQQGKPYGLLFRELDGGFTLTQRFEPQSFKLLPIMAFRVFPDGREELVRGADVEGTPLRALSDIMAAGTTVATFNGYCGAESGYVPVSATSPSLLIKHLEIARHPKAQDKPPILPAPSTDSPR